MRRMTDRENVPGSEKTDCNVLSAGIEIIITHRSRIMEAVRNNWMIGQNWMSRKRKVAREV